LFLIQRIGQISGKSYYGIKGGQKMETKKLPKVILRELTLDDVEDRYQWCLDKEVTKH
jgi:hypothetical protein